MSDYTKVKRHSRTKIGTKSIRVDVYLELPEGKFSPLHRRKKIILTSPYSGVLEDGRRVVQTTRTKRDGIFETFWYIPVKYIRGDL